MKKRVLCIDHEGGFGGSSRSLFYLIQNIIQMDRSITFEVWCKKRGPIQEMYKRIGVKCRVKNDIRIYSTLYRFSRNFYGFFQTFFSLIKSKKFIFSSADIINNNYDLVHFNHVNLYLFACVLKINTKIPFTFHIRTSLENLYEGNVESLLAKKMNQFTSYCLAKIQILIILKITKGLVFISENEKQSFLNIIKNINNGVVAYNIFKKKKIIQKDKELYKCKKFKILALENYSWSRGTDRLIEVAKELKDMGKTNVIFIIAGNMVLNSSQAKTLGLTKKNNNLEYLVEVNGLQDYFKFLGPLKSPDTTLAHSDILISLTRRVGPWGRSIIEAMSLGLPVLATGNNRGFINEKNGIFIKNYNSRIIANEIIKLYTNKNRYRKMSKEAQNSINSKCDSKLNTKIVLKFWNNILN